MPYRLCLRAPTPFRGIWPLALNEHYADLASEEVRFYKSPGNLKTARASGSDDGSSASPSTLPDRLRPARPPTLPSTSRSIEHLPNSDPLRSATHAAGTESGTECLKTVCFLITLRCPRGLSGPRRSRRSRVSPAGGSAARRRRGPSSPARRPARQAIRAEFRKKTAGPAYRPLIPDGPPALPES
jgi:hypothetical protein